MITKSGFFLKRPTMMQLLKLLMDWPMHWTRKLKLLLWCAFISPQNHFTPYHVTTYHFTPHSFHPTFISPHIHFTPRSFHPTFISPHIHFTPQSFHPTFISPHNRFTPRSFHLIFTSHHIVIIQKRLALINQLAIKLWCLLFSSQLWFV